MPQASQLFEQAAGAATLHDYQRALELYERVIEIEPTSAEAHYKRGNMLRLLGRLDAAVASYDAALERRPDYGFALCNRGAALQARGDFEAALSSYERAVAIEPNDAMAHYNRGLVLQELDRWEEALDSYDCALAIAPTFADAHYNRALTLLFLGDFERGWPAYEWRWQNARPLGIGEVRHFAHPQWRGEALIGKRILLHAEAGLGDTIQFCRYASLLAARGATVYLEVQAPLLELLTTLDGVAQVIAQGASLPPIDYHCPLMSLPLGFKTTLNTVPAATQYLCAVPEVIARRLAKNPAPGRARIGLSWSGNPSNLIDRRRSMPLRQLLAHLPVEPQYFVLQKDLRPEDETALRDTPGIVPFEDGSFAYTAALCASMDLVITVDTSVAHLSAALGRPTWILLPYVPDWRWLQLRKDTPWYPTVTLYRQQVAGDWHELLDRVAKDLRRSFT